MGKYSGSRKLSMMLNREYASLSVGFLGSREFLGLNFPSLNAKAESPSFTRKDYTLKSRCIISSNSRIPIIFLMSCYAKIAATVVEGFSRSNMVPLSLVSCMKTEKLPMHVHVEFFICIWIICSSACVKRLSFLAPNRIPFVFGNIWIIFFINNRNLAFRKFDCAVRWFRGCHARSPVAGRICPARQRLTPQIYISRGLRCQYIRG